jgi:hypothetical protein
VSLSRFHFIALGGWFMAVILTVAVRTAIGLPPSFVEAIAALAIALAPALMVMTVFRGAPPQTIAEVLYDAEHTRNLGREQLVANTINPTRGIKPRSTTARRRLRTLWYTDPGRAMRSNSSWSRHFALRN